MGVSGILFGTPPPCVLSSHPLILLPMVDLPLDLGSCGTWGYYLPESQLPLIWYHLRRRKGSQDQKPSVDSRRLFPSAREDMILML